MLKINLAANYLGQFWSTLMGFVFIPQYIRLLGIESYGLIGFFALLLTWLSLLDMGMRPTLNREMAKFTGGETKLKDIRDLLRSVELVVFSISILIGAILLFSSGWFSRNWFNFNNLTITEVSQTIAVMSAVLPVFLVEGVYRSALVGLQKHVLYSSLNAFFSTLRGVGALLVLLFLSPTIKAFFVWQLFFSFCSLAVFSLATYAVLPKNGESGSFSIIQLKKIRRFAGGLLGISAFGTVLTQFDKVVLSKLLPLSEYGEYTLAAVIASTVVILIGPVVQTWFPRLSELYAQNRELEMVRSYHQASQLLTVVFGSTAIVLLVFAEPILTLWTGDAELAGTSYKLVRILTLGNLFYGLMSLPYHMQLAYGWTRLIFNLNLIFLIIFVPVILFVVPVYGVSGAAWAWTAMNLLYVCLGSGLMFKKILINEKWAWYVIDIMIPITVAFIVSLAVYVFMLPVAGYLSSIVVIVFAGLMSVFCASLSAPLVREQMKIFLSTSRANL